MTHQDITEREKMRRLMAEVLAALDVARDGVILADEDRRIGYANDAAIDLLGLPRDMEKVKGKRLPEFQQTETFRVLAEEIVSALGAQGQWQGTGGWVRPSDGRPMHFDIRVHRLPNGGIVIVLADAGARVQVEAEERRRLEWQAQASKLEALGNLAGGIAHDFNNLLGAILGFGQFLVEDLEEGTEPRHFAERIVAVSQRGRILVQQILTFARRGPVEASDLKLSDVVGETHELLRATLPATTELTVENAVPQAVVLGDRGQLSQVFVNLCVNGSDALGGRIGAIAIRITALDRGRPELARLPAPQPGQSPAGVETWTEPDGTIWIVTGAKPVGPALSIAISDTGAGIPVSVGAQIFEPFFTTKGRGRGTGLGLAVVHRIVLEHGGAILVKTRQESGTTFEVLLPLVLGASERDGREGGGGGVHAGDKATILVVDDDESFCAWVETALKRLGYRVEFDHRSACRAGLGAAQGECLGHAGHRPEHAARQRRGTGALLQGPFATHALRHLHGLQHGYERTAGARGRRRGPASQAVRGRAAGFAGESDRSGSGRRESLRRRLESVRPECRGAPARCKIECRRQNASR